MAFVYDINKPIPTLSEKQLDVIVASFEDLTKKGFFGGRKQLMTNETEININNIADVINKIDNDRLDNIAQIRYLKNYLLGTHNIHFKEQSTNTDINNKDIINYPWAVVRDMNNYTYNKPFTCSSLEEKDAKDIKTLLKYLEGSDEQTISKDIGEDLLTVAVGYEIVLPNNDSSDPVPFINKYLKPENTFFVETTALVRNSVILTGFSSFKNLAFINDKKEEYTKEYEVLTCFTNKDIFTLYKEENGKWDVVDYKVGEMSDETAIFSNRPHLLGRNPISVYVNNKYLISELELIIPLVDMIDKGYSNWSDDQQRFCQALIVLFGVDMDEQEVKQAFQKELGILMVPPNDKGTTQQMQFVALQMAVQNILGYLTLAEKLLLYVFGSPSVQSDKTDNITGDAVKYNNGWITTDLIAEDKERLFIKHFKNTIFNIVTILQDEGKITRQLELIDIKIQSDRNKTTNLYNKVQSASQAVKDRLMTREDAIREFLGFKDAKAYADRADKYYAQQDNEELERKKDLEKTKKFINKNANESVNENDKGVAKNDKSTSQPAK